MVVPAGAVPKITWMPVDPGGMAVKGTGARLIPNEKETTGSGELVGFLVGLVLVLEVLVLVLVLGLVLVLEVLVLEVFPVFLLVLASPELYLVLVFLPTSSLSFPFSFPEFVFARLEIKRDERRG